MNTFTCVPVKKPCSFAQLSIGKTIRWQSFQAVRALIFPLWLTLSGCDYDGRILQDLRTVKGEAVVTFESGVALTGFKTQKGIDANDRISHCTPRHIKYLLKAIDPANKILSFTWTNHLVYFPSPVGQLHESGLYPFESTSEQERRRYMTKQIRVLSYDGPSQYVISIIAKRLKELDTESDRINSTNVVKSLVAFASVSYTPPVEGTGAISRNSGYGSMFLGDIENAMVSMGTQHIPYLVDNLDNGAAYDIIGWALLKHLQSTNSASAFQMLRQSRAKLGAFRTNYIRNAGQGGIGDVLSRVGP